MNPNEPLKWAKTIVAYANGIGGYIFVGVSDNRDAFGLSIEEIDKTKNLISLINDRHIFPHAKLSYGMRSVDDNAERFVLAVRVFSADSIVRYREGDFNETTDILYSEDNWSDFIDLCKEFRSDKSAPTVKELQNEEIISKDGYAKSGLMMFRDDYSGDDSLICCRLWRGNDKTGTVLDSEKIKGPLSKGLKLALLFIERNTKTGWKKTPDGGREEIRSYPREAIREAMVNAIAHRDYSIYGTQIDVDIYSDRIDIVSPGSWLLPKDYNEYPLGAIPSIRRNTIIAACFYVANLMERGGTGFQTMIESYKDSSEEKQPCVMIYPGFLDLRLFDRLYQTEEPFAELSDSEKIYGLLKASPSSVKELQAATSYKSRSRFLEEIINPLIKEEKIVREGRPKSPTAVFRLK